VRPGQEVVGIDIRYREERGRRVSGTLVLPPQMPSEGGVNVSLSYAGSSALAGGVWLGPHEAQAFSIEGVPDGEFELQAHVQTREGAPASSEPLRVVVRGADVTGLRLTLAPMASVGGTVIVEPLPEALRALPACKERAALMPTQEALVVARRDAGGRARPAGRGPQQPEAVPDEAGAFTLRNLEPGAYRVEARPLDENFYTRLVQLPAPRTAARPGAAAAPSAVLRVASGQQLTGLSIRVVAGAAGVSGRVVPAEGAAPFPPAALRLHLVPAERERAEETIHYAETTPSADGSFAFRNLAPGRYLFLARPLDAGEYPPRPAAWDADARARLRREAEAAGLTLDLQPCQRVTDFALRHPHTPGK